MHNQVLCPTTPRLHSVEARAAKTLGVARLDTPPESIRGLYDAPNFSQDQNSGAACTLWLKIPSFAGAQISTIPHSTLIRYNWFLAYICSTNRAQLSCSAAQNLSSHGVAYLFIHSAMYTHAVTVGTAVGKILPAGCPERMHHKVES